VEIVFFDASVLFEAAVSRFLLGAAQAGEYRAVWSARATDEARRSLQAAGRVHALTAFEQNLQLVRDPEVPPGDDDIEATLSRTHLKDRHVLASAAGAHANVLVTRQRQTLRS
jgi:PIN domain